MSDAQAPPFPLPDPGDPVTGPFWQHAAAGRLALPRCPACDGPLQWQPIAATGTVFAFTVVHRPFLPQMAEVVPYVTGLVVPDEAPQVRLATRFTGDVEALAIGDAVTAVFAEMRFAGVDGTVTAPLFARTAAPR